MMSMDIGTTNALIAGRHELVARMLRDSQHRGIVMIGIGSLLVRLGEWLRRDVGMPASAPGARPMRRAQAA